MSRGLDVDDFAPRLSFFFNAHIDFFEEIAKYRAARRIWARELRDTFGAKKPESWRMRFHTQTAGRVADRAAAAEQHRPDRDRGARRRARRDPVAAHEFSFDEALALPTEQAVRVALRTQQIIAEETGVANSIDPLGGSYLVEALTDRMEEQCYEYFEKIDALGGMVEAVKRGFPQREIADAAFRYQQEVEAGERRVVGVNAYTEGDDLATPILRIDPALEGEQIRRVEAVRGRRDADAVARTLDALVQAAGDPGENLMPLLLEAARADATEGEIVNGPPDRVRELHRSARLLEGRRRFTLHVPRMGASSEKKIRVVVAKPGLDGHDRGAKIIARALRDAGMEVIYTGLHQTPEQIVETVIQEDADAVGLSILSGAHMTLVPRVMQLLKEQGADDVVVTLGGTIPSDDVKELKELGVAEVFTPGASTQQAVDFIRSAVRA